eukprot:SAG11_NODE_10030_length_861_cov_7.758530_2_plen_177_part_01
MARRNLNSELTSQVHANTDGEPTELSETGAQVGPSGTATRTESVPATRMTKTNPVAGAGEARKDAEAGQVDCVHGLGGAPSSGPDQTTTTAPLNTDQPVPMQSGGPGELPINPGVQPRDSSTPPTTSDVEMTPDDQLPDLTAMSHCDAPDGSVPTTAETEKPPGHLDAPGGSVLAQT